MKKRVLIISALLLVGCGTKSQRDGGSVPSGVVRFSIGNSFGCAMPGDGSLKCWGSNNYGQIGDGTGNSPQLKPVRPINLEGANTIDSGGLHSCAILGDGSLKCWGDNRYGQAGPDNGETCTPRGTTISCAKTPIVPDLGEGRTAKMVSAGGRHTCAILNDNSLACWGKGDAGQLGTGDTGNLDTPAVVDLGKDRTVKMISVGDNHTCAILDDDSLKCWGENSDGQLGHGDTDDRGDESGEMGDNLSAVNLGADKSAKMVSAGSVHTCAILNDDTLKCWGGNAYGQLGYGDNTGRNVPEATSAINLGAERTAQAVSTGIFHTCAILDDNTLKCWGGNAYGQLGYGDDTDRNAPEATATVDFGDVRAVKDVSVGSGHSCALMDDDSLMCWGANNHGQLGAGNSIAHDACHFFGNSYDCKKTPVGVKF